MQLVLLVLLIFSPTLMARSLTDPYVLSLIIPLILAIVLFVIGLFQYFKKKPFKSWFLASFLVMVFQQALIYF